MAVGDDLAARRYHPIAILLGDDERRQELHGMARVSCDLRQDVMILAERDGDQLAEKSRAHRLQHYPQIAAFIVFC